MGEDRKVAEAHRLSVVVRDRLRSSSQLRDPGDLIMPADIYWLDDATEDVTDRLGRVIGQGQHLHNWQPAGVVGVWASGRDNDPPKYMSLSTTNERIAVLAMCSACSSVGVTVLDQRVLTAAAKTANSTSVVVP